jgi:DNA polymerase III gamma/tau subunit
VIREEVYFSMFEALSTAQADKALEIIDDMLMHGYDLAEFVSMFSIFLRDLYMVKAHGSADILNTTENLKKDYAELAKTQDAHELIRMLAIVNDELPRISRSSNMKILVETLFIKLSNLRDLQQLDQVIGQIKTGAPDVSKVKAPVPAAPAVSVKAEAVKPKQVQEPVRSTYTSPILNGKSRASNTKTSTPDTDQKTTAPAPAPEPTQTEEGHAVTKQDLESKWPDIIKCMEPKKPAVANLLTNVAILDVASGTVTMAVENDYSRATIMRSEQDVCDCLKKVTGKTLLIRLEKKEVNDNQRVVKKKEIDDATKQIIQSFEGELL